MSKRSCLETKDFDESEKRAAAREAEYEANRIESLAKVQEKLQKFESLCYDEYDSQNAYDYEFNQQKLGDMVKTEEARSYLNWLINQPSNGSHDFKVEQRNKVIKYALDRVKHEIALKRSYEQEVQVLRK